MDNQIITRKHTITIIFVFMLGSSLVLRVGGGAGRDAWLAILIGMVMMLPVLLVYSRILSLFPGKGFFEIILASLGSFFGSILIFLYVWYAFHLGTLVIRDFTEFVKIVGLHETPEFVTALFLGVLCIWAVKAGIEVIARWTAIMMPIIIAAILLITLLLIPKFKIDNLKPVLYNGMQPVLDAAFSVFTFPFAETVICTVIFSYVKSGNKPYKIYLWSILAGTSILLVTSVRSLLVLGEESYKINFFASYMSARLVKIGDFLERIEVLVAIVFLVGGFVKISICLLAAAKGIADMFSISDHRQFAAPLGMLMIIYSLTVFKSTVEMFAWSKNVYKYYAFPFEVIFPLIVWIAAEVNVRKNKRSKAKT